MNILFVGDIVGQQGRDALKRAFEMLESENREFDFIIANGENAAGGTGLTKKVADEIVACGVDVITLGNHTWSSHMKYPAVSAVPSCSQYCFLSILRDQYCA